MRGAVDGLWRSRGYGWILELAAGGYTLHHVTAQDCLAAEQGTREEFAAAWDRVEADGDALALNQAGDLTRYRFDRIAALPPVARLRAGAQRDPVMNFDALCRQFAEHYAFFGLHGLDGRRGEAWPERCRRLRGRAQAGSTDGELFGLMAELLEPLDDGHVSLAGAGRSHQRLRRMDLREALCRAIGADSPRIAPRSTVDRYAASLDALLLAPYAATRTGLKRAGNGLLAWCELAPGIGYLAVLRLFGFAATPAARAADDLPRPRAALAGFLRDDLAALEAALDQVVSDLRRCRALVLDLRVNGGGFDVAGLAIARRLCGRPRPAFSKRAVAGDGFTEPQAIGVGAAAAPLAMPAVALTSPLCASAAEVLALALRALPQVTLMGQPTAGMLSDNLIKPLPNGWELSLSNEIYTSCDGLEFEGRGIEPDVPCAALDAAQPAAALQGSLQAAVALLERGAGAAPRLRHAQAP